MVDHKVNCKHNEHIVQSAMHHVREALRLLERTGRDGECAHLKMALNASEGQVSPRDAGGERQEESVRDKVLARATGSALSIFTAILARHGLASFQEVGKILDIYAVAVADTSPQEAVILESWSSILLDIDDKGDDGSNIN